MKNKIANVVAAVVSAGVLAFPALAGEVSYEANIPLSRVSWNKVVGVPKFDASLGRLEAVRIELGGFIRGDSKVENKSSAGAVIRSTLRAIITLKYPDGLKDPGYDVIGSVAPGSSYIDSLDKFDRKLDYKGKSAATHLRQYAEEANTFETTDPDDLALFTGMGELVYLNVSATGRSTASGAGNLAASFRTEAGATIVVTYVYRSQETPPSSDEVCTRTPGYWKNHPEAWPVDSIIISNGESTDKYEQGRAIDIMQLSTSGDMTYSMFEHYVAAYLNVAPYLNSQSTPPACVSEALATAANWLIENPPGSGVSASDDAWVGSGQGELVKNLLDDYNNGRLCAPHCD